MKCLKNFICGGMKKVKLIIDSIKQFILQTLVNHPLLQNHSIPPTAAPRTTTHTIGIYRLAARVLLQITFDLYAETESEKTRLNELLFEECSCCEKRTSGGGGGVVGSKKCRSIPLYWLLLAKVEHRLYNYKNRGYVTISSPLQKNSSSNVVLQALLEVGFSAKACETLLENREFELSVFPPDHLKYRITSTLSPSKEWQELWLKDQQTISENEPLQLNLPKVLSRHCCGSQYQKYKEVQKLLQRMLEL